MAVVIAVTNPDYTAVDLRRLMSKERDGQVVRRLSALALILDGHSQTVAAERSGMAAVFLAPQIRRGSRFIQDAGSGSRLRAWDKPYLRTCSQVAVMCTLRRWVAAVTSRSITASKIMRCSASESRSARLKLATR